MFLIFDPDDVELHSKQDQLNRQKRALRLNVESIDFETRSGKINGYDVSLANCTCVDFSMNQKPCKHMYRLAHELGIFQLSGTVINDPNVKSFKDVKKERKDFKQVLLSLSFESQRILYEYIFNYRRFFPSEDSSSIAELEMYGLISSRPSRRKNDDRIKIEFTDIIEKHLPTVRNVLESNKIES